MRFLIVSTVSTTIRAFLLPYADRLRSLGWEVDAMARGVDACAQCSVHFNRLYDIKWSRNPLNAHNFAGPLRRVREVVTDGQYDIVHIHTPVAAFLSRFALAAGFHGKRPVVIYTAHGFHFQSGNSWLPNLVFASLEKFAGPWTDRLITINEEDHSAALRLGIVPPERLHYIPGIGIDAEFFCPSAVAPEEIDQVRRRFAIALGSPVFVIVGELIPRKRHRDAVAALARMSRKDARLILVGEGRERDRLRRLAARLGVGGRVHLAGDSQDVRPFILAARALILPSTQEGLPRSIMESLACGVPVIASDIRGNRDILAQGGGLMFPARDVNALSERMDYFCSNPDRAAETGAAARILVGRYGIANIVTLHEQMYTEIMQSVSSTAFQRREDANAGLRSETEMLAPPFAGK